MIASTIPAFSIPIPKGAPRKKGRNPKFWIIQGSSPFRSHGARTKNPHTP